MAVPYTFATQTTSIPLAQLDTNFSTPVTIGTTIIPLGNIAPILENVTLGNVVIASGNVTLTNVNVINATITQATITTANVTTANITSAFITTANVTTANITTANVVTIRATTANIATANVTAMEAVAANVTTLRSTNINVTTANATTAYITTANVATANVTAMEAVSANVTTIRSTTANLTTANVTTLIASVINVATANVTTLITAGITDSGNLTFTGTGNRITGDFTNATQVNKVAFQTATANSSTVIAALPSGTGTDSQWRAYNSNDPTNSSWCGIVGSSSSNQIQSSITGTGTYLPMTFSTSGSERARIDTSGNVGIGTTVNNVYDQVASARPLVVQKSDTNTTLNGSLANITIVNGDTTTNNTAQLNFAAITGASTNQYSSASISTIFGARTNTVYPSGILTFSTSAATQAPVERMRIDSSGNVGIGTSSPSVKLDVRTAAGTAVTQYLYTGSSAAAATLQFGQVGAISWNTGITASSGNFQIGLDGGGIGYNINRTGATIDYHSWLTAGSERMRIDSSGNLLVGGTSAPNNGRICSFGGANPALNLNVTTSSTYPLFVINNGASSTNLVLFQSGSGPTSVGSITYNGTLTVYGTTSDYRLKTVIGNVVNAGERLDAIKPVEYSLENGKRVNGFLAHQFAEVYPHSVSGEKDAVDEESKPVYQSMQASSAEVMADLIAEIQSLRKRVAQLESK